ncbi:hypothetical protein BS47DRAFT_1324356 [Hydnum rufescens UP504]|uniref:Uncharacterized protein n=1 Tax=Hydnum rufescens UP504 TaxID=1448309 RepID=A0A9P6B8T5_9AGAM|nr:hypothetical protein BS47DRAFT_1324356 [Hydnum rufescens UP504]
MNTIRRSPLFIHRGARTYASRPAQKPLPRPRDPLTTSTKAIITEIVPGLTFIHRPPPSAPSPHSLTTAPSSPFLRNVSSDALQYDPNNLPPPLWKGPPAAGPQTHLTEKDITEMRQLRAEYNPLTPQTHSASAIAKKFNCTPNTVRIFAPLTKEQKLASAKVIAGKRERWNNRKKLVKAIRAKRQSLW